MAPQQFFILHSILSSILRWGQIIPVFKEALFISLTPTNVIFISFLPSTGNLLESTVYNFVVVNYTFDHLSHFCPLKKLFLFLFFHLLIPRYLNKFRYQSLLTHLYRFQNPWQRIIWQLLPLDWLTAQSNSFLASHLKIFFLYLLFSTYNCRYSYASSNAT